MSRWLMMDFILRFASDGFPGLQLDGGMGGAIRQTRGARPLPWEILTGCISGTRKFCSRFGSARAPPGSAPR